MIALAFDHYLVAAFLLLAAGVAVSLVVRAITEPLAPCRRGNCPRCRGTGSEEKIRVPGHP